MKRRKLPVDPPGQLAPESTWLYRMIIRLLVPLVSKLRAWDDATTTRKKKATLALFCMVSLALLGVSLYFGAKRPHVAKPMNLPALFLPSERGVDRANIAPGQLMHLLDSIRAQPGGARLLDSLRRLRPGLLDTLEKIDVTK